VTDESVFAAALAIGSPSERAAYLDRACAGNPSLRREVEGLLAAHARSNPLDQPPRDLARTGAYEPDADEAAPTAAVGDRVGPYKLLERIGEGGMGEVWVADQLEPIKRRVALKLIKPGMDSRSVLGRFEAERQALAVMDHPNIAKVLDAGTTPDGRPFFVMELVKGTPITDFCDARRLTPKQRLELFVPVCQAIQHAHMKGIIHRDIKPSNVLVALHDETPVAKVIDFGVAKAIGQQLTEKTVYTGFGALVGTPAYMAPEQATFNQLDVDTRADVYALGVLLYELLAGSPPIEADRMKRAALDEVLRLVRDEEPPRPSQRLSTSQAKATIAATRQSDPAKLSALMKGEIDWIVMKALEKDRARRYDTANGLAKDIQRYLAGDAVEACPPTLGYRLRKAYRKNRAAVRVASAFACLCLGAVAMGAYLAVRATDAERQANANAEDARHAEAAAVEQRDEAVRVGEELRRTSYFTNINLAAASLELGQVDRTRDLLGLTRLAPGERGDLRGWEWHYLRRAVQGEKATFGGLPADGNAVAFSPDGHSLAVLGGNNHAPRNEPGQVKVWDRRTGREIYPPLAIGAGLGSAVAFSPDGRTLAASVLTSAAGRSERIRVEVRAWDAATGRPRWTREVAGASSPLSFSRDGTTISLVSSSGSDQTVLRLMVLDAATGAVRSDEMLTGEPAFGAIVFAPGGALRVATEGKDGVVRLRDAAGGDAGRVVFDAGALKTRIYDLQFNPSGTHLAVLTWDRQVRVWDVTGPHPVLAGVVPVEFASPSSSLALSPDGRSVALVQGFFGNPLVAVWDVACGRPVRVLRGHTRRVSGVVFSPDGGALATASADGTARVWDVSPPPAWEAGPRSELLASAIASDTAGRFSVLTRTFGRHEKRTEFAVSDLETGRVRFRGPPRAEGVPQMATSIDFQLSPDASRVAAASWVGPDRIQVWDISTRRPVATLPPEGLTGSRVWFGTPDQLVVGHRDHALDLWNLTAGKRVRRFSGPTDHAHQIAMTPDGRTLAASTAGGVLWVWDVGSGEQVRTIRDAELLAYPIALSADGLVLAAGGQNGRIVLWDVRTGRPRAHLAGHATGVQQLLFSPNGRRLFSSGTESLVKVWDAGTGRELITLRHGEIIRGMALSPDGHRLATVQHPFDGGQIFDATPLPEPKP
jgi:WD40 repeat protein/serine/threonine protein kinase